MTPPHNDLEQENRRLQAEVERQNLVIQVLMDRVEDSVSANESGFGLLQAALMLEEQVRVRTLELNEALGRNTQITRDLQQSQRELLRHQAHLSELVTEQTRDLMSAKDVAEAANRAKSEFLATMSHELRTPMNGIMGMTDMALDMVCNAQQRSCLELVKSSAESLLGTLDSMLDYVAIEAGKLVFLRERVDLPHLVADAVRMQLPRASDKDLVLSMEVSPSMPTSIWGDGGRWRQILFILLDNAIKFTSQGSVTVQVTDVTVDGQLYGVLRVADTGIGIALDKQAKIFEPLTQGDSSPTRSFGGMGLGLSLARQLVEKMHGAIALESVLGRGSVFTVRVPLELNTTPLTDVPSTPAPVGSSFDYLRALQEGYNGQEMLQAARRFTLESEQLVFELRRAVLSGDSENTRRLCLSLQAMLLSFGAIPAAQQTMSITAHVKSGRLGKASEDFAVLEREITVIQPILKTYFGDAVLAEQASGQG